MKKTNLLIIFASLFILSCNNKDTSNLEINELGYFEMPGLNVMVFHDFYPEGHQGGVGIIQNGNRIATNGDIRLEQTPGQWQPIPKVSERFVDTANNEIIVRLTYPDSSKHRKGFNPIIYPDLYFNYDVNVKAEGTSFRITIDLDRELPSEWIGKVGFNIELFPGYLFGKTYYMDEQAGLFPTQANGPAFYDNDGKIQLKPLATGKILTIAPESDKQRMTIESTRENLQLMDGRVYHNNGWFVVRSAIPAGATENAVEWIVSPNVIENWKYKPVIHTSQVGYHPEQQKVAVIEFDRNDDDFKKVILNRVLPDGMKEIAKEQQVEIWGDFLRYKYMKFDFSSVREPGTYMVTYGDIESNPFQIRADIYNRHVWQPTLEYFLPVQMCHMRVNEGYRVWHGLCHMDDALMAPVDTNHFDGYKQGPKTLTTYKPLQHVPGLNQGGWHDAGDYDLRVESQAGTVYKLTLAMEQFGVDYDQTTIDQETRIVEIHRPDGENDMLQQIEHGVLTILGGYRNLGRLYRGIICQKLRQYVLLGDGSTMTDGKTYDPNLAENEVACERSGTADDRWVFTEENPSRELYVAGCLAAASRVLKDYDKNLANECLAVAETLWEIIEPNEDARLNDEKIQTLVELLLATQNENYKSHLIELINNMEEDPTGSLWILGRVMPMIKNENFIRRINEAAQGYSTDIAEQEKENPFGVPYEPHIWGAGWGIQRFGVEQYFLHIGWPEFFKKDYMLHALNFVLGVHPGTNTASFASGVGSHSLLVAYGVNRADWSFIPGGVGSGTALIRPDYPEMKTWPFLWQQTEYVMGGGATNYMFLVLAADKVLQ